MPSPNAWPSQLNSAGSEPFASNEALRILNAEPPEELLLEEDEELLDDELLELDELEEELLGVLPSPPPQAASAADNAVTLQAKKILFMVVSRFESQNLLDIKARYPRNKPCLMAVTHPDYLSSPKFSLLWESPAQRAESIPP